MMSNQNAVAISLSKPSRAAKRAVERTEGKEESNIHVVIMQIIDGAPDERSAKYTLV